MTTLRLAHCVGGFRFHCAMTNKYYGPVFANSDDAKAFCIWYCRDPRFIETWVNPRTWESVLNEWALSHQGSKDVIMSS